MKRFVTVTAVITAMALSVLTGCDRPAANKVTHLYGTNFPNTELCKDPAKQFALRTKKGDEAEVIHCLSEVEYGKYQVGSTFP